jgi:hypothetical protein
VPGLDWNIVSVIVSAVGVVIAYYLYRRSIRKPIPSYVFDYRVRIAGKTQMKAPGL